MNPVINFWFLLSLICNGKHCSGLNSFSWNIARKGTSSTVKIFQCILWREPFGSYSELVFREHSSCPHCMGHGLLSLSRGWYYFLLGVIFLSNAYTIAKFHLLWKTWGRLGWQNVIKKSGHGPAPKWTKDPFPFPNNLS